MAEEAILGALSAHKQLLATFSGADRIESGNRFWNELLLFPVHLTKLPPAKLEAALTPYCEQLGELLPLNMVCVLLIGITASYVAPTSL